MRLSAINSPSFKSYIPVTYYAKCSDNQHYRRVTDERYIRLCQSFVIRNLNNTAKNMRNQNFIDFYAGQDKAYKSVPAARSIYDKNNATVYLVTGKDVDEINKIAKPIGAAKSASLEKTGSSKSFEASVLAKSYFTNALMFLKNSCSRVKSSDGTPLSLRVYFYPKYNKKGEVKGFDFSNARFVRELKN